MTFTFQWGHFWLGFVSVLFGQWFVLALLLLRYKLKHPWGIYFTEWYRAPNETLIRIWGFGLDIRNVEQFPLWTSEKQGKHNFIMLRRRVIRFIKP